MGASNIEQGTENSLTKDNCEVSLPLVEAGEWQNSGCWSREH